MAHDNRAIAVFASYGATSLGHLERVGVALRRTRKELFAADPVQITAKAAAMRVVTAGEWHFAAASVKPRTSPSLLPLSAGDADVV